MTRLKAYGARFTAKTKNTSKDEPQTLNGKHIIVGANLVFALKFYPQNKKTESIIITRKRNADR